LADGDYTANMALEDVTDGRAWIAYERHPGAPSKEPVCRTFVYAGGGTRTPDTRIMIAAILVGFGLGKPSSLR
jgi:hypothetical protein